MILLRREGIPTEPRFVRRIAGYQAKHQRRRRWYKIVSALACVVVFCTTYALILPALTMETERVLDCQAELHAHTADCYNEAGELRCGQADFAVHTHSALCYDAEGGLVCTLPEIEAHEHTDSCYTEKEILTCGEQETAGHQHGGECYEAARVPACGQEETAGHQHGDSCYTPGALLCTDEAHEHTADCYAPPELTCGQEAGAGAHTHDDSCYQTVNTLICTLAESEGGHVHTGDCYGYERVLSCGREEIILHTHDGACYDADGALTCGQLAVSEHMHTEDCCAYVQRPSEETPELAETEELAEQPALLAAPAAQAESSSFTWTYEECKIQFYLVDESGNPLSANVGDITAKEKELHIIDSIAPTITGYTYARATLTIDEDTQQVYSVATENYKKDELNGKVGYIRFYTTNPIEEDGCINKTEKECKKTTFTINLVYQRNRAIHTITFQCMDTDGTLLTATVDSITNEDSESTSYTFRDLAPEIDGYTYQKATIPTDSTNAEVSSVTTNVAENAFRFYLGSDYYSRNRDVEVTLHYAEENAPRSSFTMTYTWETTSETYTITFQAQDSDGNFLTLPEDVKDIVAEENQKYLLSNIVPQEIDGYRYSGATMDGYNIYSVTTSPTIGYALRFNITEPVQAGQWLSRPASPSDTQREFTITLIYAEPTDYTGDWAIVNEPNDRAAMLSNYNAYNRLEGKTVPVVEIDGEKIVTDASVTVWRFEKQDDGTYYISTEVNGETKYLNIPTEYEGRLTLDTAPQNISVMEGTGDYAGQVLIYVTDGDDNPYHVNLYGSNVAAGFQAYGDQPSAANSWHTLCKVNPNMKGALSYDLGITSTKVGKYTIADASNDDRYEWKAGETPALTVYEGGTADSATQIISDEGGQLYAPGAADNDGQYIYTCVGQNDQARQSIREAIENANNGVENAGKVFRFDGWTANVDGMEYTFAPGAEAIVNEGGSITITDSNNNNSVTVPTGTRLTAKWTQVSDIVLFYVNYGATILDVEGDVTGRGVDQFTGIVGVGMIYFGDNTVGTDNTFATEANAAIRAKIVPEYDPESEETQIVMQYATQYDPTVTDDNGIYDSGAGYNVIDHDLNLGINSTEAEEALLKFIHDNTDVTIQTVNEDGSKTTVNNQNATPDNYTVRWYVLKDQADAWHIDGVMVAKTQKIVVTKTFSGLDGDQVAGLLRESEKAGYNIPVKMGNNEDTYFTMNTETKASDDTSSTAYGYYDYYGKIGEKQSYSWIMNAILGEQYTLTETEYRLDDYDVSTIVVNYYTDGEGESGYDSAPADTTEGLHKKPVIGGETTAVSFNNFYTKTDTGALAIHKSSSDGDALQGAKFTLTKNGNVVQTATSNSNGSVFFNNLTEGTYILAETKAPEGYQKSNATWTVEVRTDEENHTVKVTVYENDADGKPNDTEGTVCYDGKIIKSYSIRNAPQDRTVRISKVFSGDLEADELNALVKSSSAEQSDGYYIDIVPKGSDAPENKLYLSSAARSQDGLTFTWTVASLDLSKTYRIVEHNYVVKDKNGDPEYEDVAVTAAVNGEPADVTVDRDAGTAAISGVVFGHEDSKSVEITNRYTDTFTLEIRKIDAATQAPLTGAEFELYGPYKDAAHTSQTIGYVKDDKTKTAYYIATYVIDSGGSVAWYDRYGGEDKKDVPIDPPELRFGKEYVLKETKAPDGYVTQTIPYFEVAVDAPDYAHGVYTNTVENSKGSLPQTGGAGTLPFMMGGALITAGSLLYEYQRRRKRKGGS